MHRRAFLGALGVLACAPVLTFSRAARAGRLVTMSRDARGTTMFFGLEHAPFPSGGAPYRDDTVIVFVPEHYRFREGEGIATLVHFRGHNTTAEHAVEAHALREQLADSKQNAVLVVPQLATLAADSSCGKLESPGGLVRLLGEALTAAAVAGSSSSERSALPLDARLGTVCVSAHSGGYHAAASAIRVGGADIREVYLFDALYAEVDTFRDWVRSRRGEPLHRRHKLVSYYTEGGATEAASTLLRGELEKAGVLCEHEVREGDLSRGDLSHADAVFVRTGLFHSNVTWETNALRDCLYASALPRHLATTWFSRKLGARPIDRRQR
jgi:hypothetical protein